MVAVYDDGERVQEQM